MSSKNPQDVNSTAGASTSDGAPRPNGMTAEQWLERVLYSGQVTRVAQHLALVIHAMALLQQKNGVPASLRELERITGWGRAVLRDRLSELDAFLHCQIATGRRKSIFELQGLIEDAIGAALVASIEIKTTAIEAVHSQEADCQDSHSRTETRDSRSKETALPDSHSAKRMDVPADHCAERMAIQSAIAQATLNFENARSITTRATKESPSEIVISKKEMAPLPAPPDGVVVNCETIRGPGFVIDLNAVDMEASLRGLSTQFARTKAEAMARQWARSGKVPHSPDATIARALREEANSAAVHGVRLSQAHSYGPKKTPVVF